MSLSGIYGVLHRPSERWYVGRSSDIRTRWRLHRRMALRGSRIPFHDQLRASPLNDFIWIMLEPCSRDTAAERERVWIEKLRAFEDGFNCTAGGYSTPSDDPATRAKMSAAGKARTDRPFLGRRHSAETLATLNAAAKRRGPEWRAKISASHTGKALSDEHRAKLREAMLGKHAGELNPFFGRKHSADTKRKFASRQHWRTKRAVSTSFTMNGAAKT